MLEKFKIENNSSRDKVLEYLKKSKFRLKYFKVQDYLGYSGGIELLDKENRSIIIYYDESTEKVKVVYKDFEKSDIDLKTEISVILWDYYSCLVEETEQVARLKRNKGMIQFYRYDIKDPKHITHTSREFNEANQAYDIYYYLLRQIKRMKVEKEELY